MRPSGVRFVYGVVLGLTGFGGFTIGSAPWGVPLWLRDALGVRIPVELLGERMFRMLPPVWFSILVNAFEDFGRRHFGIEHFGKLFALMSANLVIAGIAGAGALAAHGVLAARGLRGLRAGALVAAAAWLAWGVVLVPLFGGGWMGTGAGPVPSVWAMLLAGSALYGIGIGYLVAGKPSPRRAPPTEPTPPGRGLQQGRAGGQGGQPPFRAATADGDERVSRREILTRCLAIVGGLAAGSALATWLSHLVSHTAAWAQSVISRIQGIPPEITPNDRFYTVSKNFFDPDVNIRNWTLEVSGLVENPLRLTIDDLKSLPTFSRPHTFACISNPVGGDLIGNTIWKGVRVRDLLSRARPKREAHKVVFRSADGYHTAVPLADLMEPDAFLAYEMNGGILPRKHGFPLRAVIPGLFGMKNPKWITKLELTDKDHVGYWEAQGWSDEAVVKTMSKFTTPTHGASLPAGPIGVGGVAYAGDRGISMVEVSFDDGRTWRRAEVKPAMGKHSWVLWGVFWDAKPGRYTLKVRARDGVGTLQEAKVSPPLPDGATGYHTIRVTVR
ncbi:MAG: molybdopterin-dependent oxidoreductase [Armatimonadota bacterium]|nr:molybdopterin-dependent oxidoreductase [Armatimonadota bacterium]MDR5697084.1 molybdopterin-dependent oxidoreductase [Armatimonadota bacterium]